MIYIQRLRSTSNRSLFGTNGITNYVQMFQFYQNKCYWILHDKESIQRSLFRFWIVNFLYTAPSNQFVLLQECDCFHFARQQPNFLLDFKFTSLDTQSLHSSNRPIGASRKKTTKHKKTPLYARWVGHHITWNGQILEQLFPSSGYSLYKRPITYLNNF